MNIKVIVKVPQQTDHRKVRDHLLRRYRVDATDLLQMALENWDLLENEDFESLVATLEAGVQCRQRRISRYIDDGRMSHSEYIELVVEIANCLFKIHEALQPILQPLVEGRWRREPNYRLARYIGMDAAAVIEIGPR